MKKQMLILLWAVAITAVLWYGNIVINELLVNMRLEIKQEAIAKAKEQDGILEKWRKEAPMREEARIKEARIKEARIKEGKLLDAWCMAQTFVEQNLKCPRTVKWPWVSYIKCTTYLGNGRYQSASYFDAQNSFGALIRTNFICIVKDIGGGKWRDSKVLLFRGKMK